MLSDSRSNCTEWLTASSPLTSLTFSIHPPQLSSFFVPPNHPPHYPFPSLCPSQSSFSQPLAISLSLPVILLTTPCHFFVPPSHPPNYPLPSLCPSQSSSSLPLAISLSLPVILLTTPCHLFVPPTHFLSLSLHLFLSLFLPAIRTLHPAEGPSSGWAGRALHSNGLKWRSPFPLGVVFSLYFSIVDFSKSHTAAESVNIRITVNTRFCFNYCNSSSCLLFSFLPFC